MVDRTIAIAPNRKGESFGIWIKINRRILLSCLDLQSFEPLVEAITSGEGARPRAPQTGLQFGCSLTLARVCCGLSRTRDREDAIPSQMGRVKDEHVPEASPYDASKFSVLPRTNLPCLPGPVIACRRQVSNRAATKRPAASPIQMPVGPVCIGKAKIKPVGIATVQ